MRTRSYAGLGALIAFVVAVAFFVGSGPDDLDTPAPVVSGPGPRADDEQASEKLGFPFTATKNTVRVRGGDVIADAAGVATAVFPGTDRSTRPTAVVLVDKDDWQAGISASVMAARPIGAPILISDGGELPPVTADALESLDPTGSELSRDAQVIRIGDEPPRPEGFKTAVIKGEDVYERGAAIDRFFSAAQGRPSRDVIVASGEDSGYAMPAAAWAARAGDSVLLTAQNELPEPTRRALEEHEKPNIFVLGPEDVISEKVADELRKLGKVSRIEGPGPVENAIAFARYQKGDFGWNIRAPGYNFTLASTERPLNAAAAASLATNGTFAPLLVTDQAESLPEALETYLLSVQPGYENDDPGQAVYNRVWILGDDSQVSVAAQARIDEISELIPVQVGTP